MLLYFILSNGTIWCKDVLNFNINMIQETLLQLVDASVYILSIQWKILIGIEDDNILETKPSCLMTLDKFLEDWSEGGTRANAHNIFSSFLFSLLDISLKLVGYVNSALFYRWEDVCRNLLKACDFRAFYGSCRMIKLLRYLIEYYL